MSALFQSAAASFAAATVAILSLTMAATPGEAAPRGKHYCERVCFAGVCSYSCTETQRSRRYRKPPTYRPQPEPQPVPNVIDGWRDTAFSSGGSGGGGGGGGGGGNR